MSNDISNDINSRALHRHSSSANEKVYRYKVLQTAVAKFGQSLSKLSPDQQREAEQIALRQIELESCLLASSEARNLIIPSGSTDAAVAEIICRYTSEDEFNHELASNHLDMATLRRSVNRELLVAAVMDVVAAQVPDVSDIDARLYYYFHLEKFKQVETRNASHILLTINPRFPENTREQALARLTLIAKRLRKNPARFAEQAGKHSECPTAMEGGFLGRVKQGLLFPELDKILFNLPVGVLSEVVESQLGFHILLCDAIYPASTIEIDEVVATITEKLTQRKRKIHQQRWLRALLQKSPGAYHASLSSQQTSKSSQQRDSTNAAA